jgi:SAM-dependent methyltransferase
MSVEVAQVHRPQDGYVEPTETDVAAFSKRFTGTEGTYMLPHHQKEIERLQKQHLFMNSTTSGQLLLVPSPSNDTKSLRVLDAGCADGKMEPFPLYPHNQVGSTSDTNVPLGTWLRDLPRQYPGWKLDLHGIDIGASLFPIEHTQSYSPVDLRTHDVTEPFPSTWGWSNSFDVIHQRLLIWGIKSNQWPAVIRNYRDLLKPGGYLQLVEAEWIPKSGPSDLPQLRKQALLQDWSTKSFGMDIDVAYHLEDYLRDAGFDEVTKIQFDHGYGAKAKDPT